MSSSSAASRRSSISIHALREEGDGADLVTGMANGIFLSTPSVRRATGKAPFFQLVTAISIHALREEGDVHERKLGSGLCQISIHALREEGDSPAGYTSLAQIISIHALREEGDRLRCGQVFQR